MNLPKNSSQKLNVTTLGLLLLFNFSCGGVYEGKPQDMPEEHEEPIQQTQNLPTPSEPGEPITYLSKTPRGTSMVDTQTLLKTAIPLQNEDYILNETHDALLVTQKPDEDPAIELKIPASPADSTPFPLKQGYLYRTRSSLVFSGMNSNKITLNTKQLGILPDSIFFLQNQNVKVQAYMEFEKIEYSNFFENKHNTSTSRQEKIYPLIANFSCAGDCKTLNVRFSVDEQDLRSSRFSNEDRELLKPILQNETKTVLRTHYPQTFTKKNYCVEFYQRTKWGDYEVFHSCTFQNADDMYCLDAFGKKVSLDDAQKSINFCSRFQDIVVTPNPVEDTLKIFYIKFKIKSNDRALYVIPQVEHPNLQLLDQEIEFKLRFNAIIFPFGGKIIPDLRNP